MPELVLYGSVGGSFFGEDSFTALDVSQKLAGMSGDLTVRLNSGGGIASDGQAIFNMLRDHDGAVHVLIDGVAASAASLIAMAGDTITMKMGAWMLIHDPAQMFTPGRGTADDHRGIAGMLDKISDVYAEVYADRTGLSADDVRGIMKVETVFKGKEAVDAGFATDFDAGSRAAAAAQFDYRIYANAPQKERKASESLGKAQGKEAVMAMIAGVPRKPQEATMVKGLTPKMGAGLASFLDGEIDDEVERRGDGATRSDVIDDMASAAGISASTVNEILSGRIDCPPIDRLEGFAEVLSASANRIISAAEGDGCEYDTGDDSAEAAQKEEKKMTAISQKTKTVCALAPRAYDSASTQVAPTGMTPAQVAHVFEVADMAGQPIAFAKSLVSENISMEAALDKITAKWRESDPMPNPTTGAPRATIIRDERDTRREAMEGALVAQLSRATPDDKARQYMGASIVEMAAICADDRGPLRYNSDRERVLMAASHSVTDFPAIFENALNKQLESRYQAAAPTYRDIARRMTFNDFRPHPMIRTGDFPDMKKIGEGGEIQFGTFSENKETVSADPFAMGLRISRQMLINDEMDAISQVLSDRGLSVARSEDRIFYEMMLGGTNADGPTLNETSRQVFNATDGTKASTGTAITVAAITAGRAAMMKKTSLDGAKLNILPAILLVGPDKLTEAQQVVAPIQAQQVGEFNPFSGALRVVSTAEITGNAWYLLSDPAVLNNFVYGFLSGFEAPRLRMDEPFGQQGVAFSVEHDFGVGAVDFRGGWKNAGA